MADRFLGLFVKRFVDFLLHKIIVKSVGSSRVLIHGLFKRLVEERNPVALMMLAAHKIACRTTIKLGTRHRCNWRISGWHIWKECIPYVAKYRETFCSKY